MCFSVQADVAVGLGLMPLAVVSLREVRLWRELPFAALPALFAVHQCVEAVVWLGVDGRVGTHVQSAAAFAYAVYALAVLPVLLPLAVLLLEPAGARARVAPFFGLGVIVAAYLGGVLLTGPVRVVEHHHALQYVTGVHHGGAWAALYVVAVIGPPLLSSYRDVVAFGLVNLIGLVTVAVLLSQAFTSLWCIYAAVASALVVRHLRRRRQLPAAPLGSALRA